MGRAVLNGVLGVALLVSLVLNVIVRQPPTRPNFEYFPDMARTARYNAFSPNPNFADGMTLRMPVPGTIARELPPLPRPQGGTDLVNQFPSGDPVATERGAQVYADFCQPCHAADAKGDGLVVQRGFPRPPSLLLEKAQKLGDAQIFRLITNGQGSMPGYAAQISRDDRWRVILHLRALQRSGAPAPGSAQ
jgi:mono/diheme cytochrome c family protein